MVDLKQRDGPFPIADWEVRVVQKRLVLDRASALLKIEQSEERARYWEDDTYMVKSFPLAGPHYFCQLLIRRKDMKPIHNYMDMQAIKNQVVSPAWEAVELYPNEDRFIDTSNTYHLWCAPYINVGYQEGQM